MATFERMDMNVPFTKRIRDKKRFTTQYMVMNRFRLHNSCHEFSNNLN